MGVRGACTSTHYASSRLVTLGTPCTRRMEDQEWIVGQVFERNPDNVPGASEPCISVSYAPFGLETPFP